MKKKYISIYQRLDCHLIKTRTKTSIGYAKENYGEKRERKKGRRRNIKREGEIREREREVKGIESERRVEKNPREISRTGK